MMPVFDRDKWLDIRSYGHDGADLQSVKENVDAQIEPWISLWWSNIDANMSQHVSGKRAFITSEYGKHEGPVLICGAGPSLSRDIKAVKGIYTSKQMPIICVDRAYMPLHRRGIVPSLVVTADAQEKVLKFLRCVGEQDTVCLSINSHPLVSDMVTKSAGKVLWHGTINPFSCFWWLQYQKYGKHIATTRTGLVVTHNAVDMAIWMGYNPIHVIGNDLCFYSEDEIKKYFKKYFSDDREYKEVEPGKFAFETFWAAKACFEQFPCFHPDIDFVDFSDGLTKKGWKSGKFDLVREAA